MKQHSDLHKHGVFCVVDPEGNPICATFNTTARSARAAYLHTSRETWSAAEEKGYKILEYAPIAEVVQESESTSQAEILPGIPQTANDWQLFEMPGAEDAARKIAGELSKLLVDESLNMVAASDSVRLEAAARVARAMAPIMKSYSSMGATDTEPRGVLRDLLQRTFKYE